MKAFRPILLILWTAASLQAQSLRLESCRAAPAASHLRAVDFVPGSLTAFAAGFDGTILKTTDGGETWEIRGLDPAVRFYDIQVVTSSDIVACGSEGAVWKSGDAGAHWSSVPFPEKVRLTGICFVEPRVGWVSGDRGLIMKTVDGGSHWKHQVSGTESGLRSIRFSDERTGFCAGYQGIVLKTEDGGERWIDAKAPKEMSIYSIDTIEGGGMIYTAGSFGTILRSMDSGNSWQFMPNVTTNFLRAISFSSPQKGLAAGYGWILRYDSGKDLWKKAAQTEGYNWHGLALNDLGCGIAVGQWGCVARTMDNGLSWVLGPSHLSVDLNEIAVDAGGRWVAAGAEGFVFAQNTGSARFDVSWLGTPQDLTTAASPATGVFVLGSNNGVVFRSMDGGRSWEQSSIGKECIQSIRFPTATTGFAAGGGGMIFKTTDQGVTWHDLSLNQKINLRGMIFLNADRGLIFGDGGAVFETEDSGQTWTRHYTGITSDLIGGAHGLSGKTILLDASGCILSSTEFGHNSSWGRQRAREGAVALSDDGRLIAGSSGEIVDTVSGTAIRTDALIRCIVGIDPATYAVCGERGFINLIRLSP